MSKSENHNKNISPEAENVEKESGVVWCSADPVPDDESQMRGPEKSELDNVGVPAPAPTPKNVDDENLSLTDSETSDDTDNETDESSFGSSSDADDKWKHMLDDEDDEDDGIPTPIPTPQNAVAKDLDHETSDDTDDETDGGSFGSFSDADDKWTHMLDDEDDEDDGIPTPISISKNLAKNVVLANDTWDDVDDEENAELESNPNESSSSCDVREAADPDPVPVVPQYPAAFPAPDAVDNRMVNKDGSLMMGYRTMRTKVQLELVNVEEEEDSANKMSCVNDKNKQNENEQGEDEVETDPDEDEVDRTEIDEIVAEWRANRHSLPVQYYPIKSDLREPQPLPSTSSKNYPGLKLKPLVPGTPPEPYIFTCVSCKLTFLKKTDFTKHLFEVHRSEKRKDVWNCADCGLNFGEESKYLRHLELFKHFPGGGPITDYDLEKKRLKCPLCWRLFEAWDFFVFHWENDHPPEEEEAFDSGCGEEGGGKDGGEMGMIHELVLGPDNQDEASLTISSVETVRWLGNDQDQDQAVYEEEETQASQNSGDKTSDDILPQMGQKELPPPGSSGNTSAPEGPGPSSGISVRTATSSASRGSRGPKNSKTVVVKPIAPQQNSSKGKSRQNRGCTSSKQGRGSRSGPVVKTNAASAARGAASVAGISSPQQPVQPPATAPSSNRSILLKGTHFQEKS